MNETFYKKIGIKYRAYQLEDTDDFPISCYFHEIADFIEKGLRSGGMYLRLTGRFLSLNDG